MGLEVTVYRLGDDLAWKKTGGGEVIGGSPEDVSGVFAMEAGPEAYGYSMNVFLTEFQEMELDGEIPVALLLRDSGTGIRSHSLAHYYDPSAFEGMDLVQAVTLTFTSSPAL